MNLKGQKIVVIGGSSGIGFATAKEALDLGGEVIIASRSEEKLKQAKESLNNRVTTYSLNIGKEDEIKDFFKNIGEFDHLVTPGAIVSPGTFIETQLIRDSFDSKFFGQYFSAKYSQPYLKNSIVFVTGVYARRPMKNSAIMAAINGAVESLAKALAQDMAPIRVNVVAPGYIDTPRLKDLSQTHLKAIEDIPLKRVGTPDELAQGIIYLMKNTYVTGSTLSIDGGYSLN